MVQEDICLLQQLWSDVNDKRTYKVVVVSKDDIEANFTKYFPRVRNFFFKIRENPAAVRTLIRRMFLFFALFNSYFFVSLGYGLVSSILICFYFFH